MSGHHDDEILGKAYDARLMRRLLGYLHPYRGQVALAFVAIIVGAVAQLAQPYLIKIAIDRYIATGQLVPLDSLAALYLFILVIAFVADYGQTWTMQLTGQKLMFDLRMEVYAHLQRLDLRYYDKNPVGRLMTRVTSDVDVLNDLFTAGVVTIFGDVFTLVGIMGVLLWMNWRLALFTFAVLPLIVIITQWFRRNVRESYRIVRGWIARINGFLQENITGMSTVQLFRREALNFARFDDIDRRHRDANIESIFYYAVFYPAVEAVGALASALIIWYGGANVLSGTLTLGALVAFLQYAQRFFRPISDMSEKFNVLQSAMASSERIFGLLDEPIVVQPPARPATRPAAAAGHVRFEGVWFTYGESAIARSGDRQSESAIGRSGDRQSESAIERSGDGRSESAIGRSGDGRSESAIGRSGDGRSASAIGRSGDGRSASAIGRSGDGRSESAIGDHPTGDWILKDISFDVAPGERVGIVGATGSGKTTLINLLLRFYDVQLGRITIDGVDVRDLDLAELRGLFSLVLQDVHLFSGTIADNIRLGARTIDDDQVRRAAEAVHADAFISRLPGQYDSPVAERGATLSVGQKQLLSFARALAFDPRVLILDEATSSVDTETELLIRDALQTLMAGRTTIAIAHRLSTIQDMDKILVLHKGRLREAGTHHELLAARGIYYRLFELQYKSGERTAQEKTV